MCVRASNANDRVDAELKPILQQLKFTRYTGFHLIDTQRRSLESGQETTFNIEGERKIRIELLSHDETAAKLRIRMFNAQGRQQLDTTVSIHRNRSFMVAGPKVGEDVLILPVSVRY
jgi:hypothetical protein